MITLHRRYDDVPTHDDEPIALTRKKQEKGDYIFTGIENHVIILARESLDQYVWVIRNPSVVIGLKE